MAVVVDLSQVLRRSLANDGFDEMARGSLELALSAEELIHDLAPGTKVSRRQAAEFPASEKSSVLVVGAVAIGLGLGGIAVKDPERAKRILEQVLRVVQQAIVRPRIKLHAKSGDREIRAEVTGVEELAPAAALLADWMNRISRDRPPETEEPSLRLDAEGEGFKALPQKKRDPKDT